jgi:hypothetical protein
MQGHGFPQGPPQPPPGMQEHDYPQGPPQPPPGHQFGGPPMPPPGQGPFSAAPAPPGATVEVCDSSAVNIELPSQHVTASQASPKGHLACHSNRRYHHASRQPAIAGNACLFVKQPGVLTSAVAHRKNCELPCQDTPVRLYQLPRSLKRPVLAARAQPKFQLDIFGVVRCTCRPRVDCDSIGRSISPSAQEAGHRFLVD